MGIHIITDTSCDLALDYAKANTSKLTVLGMPIELDGVGYIDDLGETFTHDFFYKQMREGTFPSTSQINPMTYEEAYTKAINKGDDIICIGLSSGLSNTINSAILAMHNIKEQYPDAKIKVVDTLAGSIGLGMLVYLTIEKINEGIEYDILAQWIEDSKLKINHWFAIDDLDHLKKGGRIPPAMAIIGTALKVKPILTVRHNGKLEAYTKIRGRNKSINFLVSKLEQHIGQAVPKVVMIGHADCIEDAEKLARAILGKYKPQEIIITKLSQTIATHVGVGMLAVSFLGEHVREDIV
ncbi:MAG: DegV family protein [Vallitaleaceae bacterium]|jgi:DegV family protein with EDD domain|nr:DegV family protein [Vallitaleaceae bacterium]